MVFNTGAALLDAIVLAVVSKEEEGTYGYKITQDVRKAIEVSESTLYPVLRRLQKDGYLTGSAEEETGDITRLRRPAKKSWQNTAASGNRILRKYQNYFQERSQKNE